ncbi:MAG: sensor histidine kinase [Acidimicrobiales bacterium]
MSLRRRLLIGMLVVMIGAIVTTDLVTSSSLRSFLYGRLDEEADLAQHQAYTYIEGTYARALALRDQMARTDPAAWLAQIATPPPSPAGSALDNAANSAVAANPSSSAAVRDSRPLSTVLVNRLDPDAYVEIIESNGAILFRDPSGTLARPDPAPVLPSHLVVSLRPHTTSFGTSHGAYVQSGPTFETSAVGHGGSYYRGEAVAVPGGVLVTMIPLAPTDQTLASLTRTEVIVSIVVALTLVLVTLVLVRIGLRPLDDMTATARAISEGDLRRRIKRTDERSEVGRLGKALNGMLVRIEAALSERRASEARLRRFVADASHELRTPLTSIRGYAELLHKEALSDDASRRRAAARIEHEAARMGVLVEELLMLARLDQGGRPLDLVRVDLTSVVGDAVEAARAAEPDRSFFAMLRPGVFVKGDALRLRQIADNLLDNAVVHTPPATPVHVSVEAVAEQGMARLSVADEGPGLDPEHAGRVFDRFYRGADARGRPGTGLGLSIVAALTEAHGGTAAVGDAARGGAQFTVEIPLWVPATPPSASDETASDEAASQAASPANGAENELDTGHPARR